MDEKRFGIWSRIVVFGLVFTLLTSSLGLLTAEKATAADTREEVVLRIAMQDDVKSLNPLVAGDVWTWNVLGYLYDTPLNVDLINSEKFIPYIATNSMNYTADSLFHFDNKTDWKPAAKAGQITVYYNFTNVKFHDDHNMDINDILFGFGIQALNPDWASSVKCLMDKGGEAGSNYSDTHWLGIEKYYESADGLHAALRFYLQTPYADFIRNTLSVFILPQHIWGNKIGGQDYDNADPFLPATDPRCWSTAKALAFENKEVIGSGPFKFDSWTPGQQAKITTWRTHFSTPQPLIDGMVFKIYKTAEQAVQALQQGDIDYIAWSIPPTYVPDLINDENIGLSQSSERGFFYMAYNMRKKSFGYLDNDPLKGDYGKTFRKAVAHCVNKKEIVERLLQNFGIAADGPVSAIDTDWYNDSLPQFGFDTDQAKRLLDYGADNIDGTADDYVLTDPTKPAGKNNWWKNPDGSFIGSGDGGKIEILTPPADYDPIRAQAGIMIATNMQEVGINAESIALDFGTIVNRIDQRNFDMYILGWRIGSDPTDFLHAFFHSSTAESGQNYPGYRNATFDTIIDHARVTGDPVERKNDVKNAQAAIAYDQPYNVLYFRTNIEAYRSDRFVNWTVGSTGSIFSWRSVMGIHPPSEYRLKASLSIESPVPSESESEVIVTVKDQAGLPVQGARVDISCANGTFVNAQGLREYNATTQSNGQVKVKWIAPYVAANATNDTKVAISLMGATKNTGDIKYDPAPSKVAVVIVKKEGATFLRLRTEVETDVIEAGSTTQITVTVKDQDGNPIPGATVEAQPAEAGPTITGDTTTDADGIARLVFNAPATVAEEKDFAVDITVSHGDFSGSAAGVVSVQVLPVDVPPPPPVPFPPGIVIVGVIAAVAIVGGRFVYGRRPKNKGS
ncbi:MAG: ABC transporter substrate-binding protein [Methanobacteriota archaeon]